MDILERYLDAVAAQLPRDTRDDIVAELRDLLLTRFETEEARLGRPLTDDEREAILRETGHPLVVAARYRKGPQSLIGPELFPWWLFGLKAGLAILVAVQLLGLAFDVLGGTANAGRDIAQAFHGVFGSALTLIGALTLAGAILEHYRVRPPWMDNWRVKDLGVLRLSDPANWASETAQGGDRAAATPSPSRTRAWRRRTGSAGDPLAGIIAGVVFLLWWTGVIHFQGLAGVTLDDGRALFVAAPIWATLHTTILLYVLADVAIDVSRLLQPGLRRVQALLAIAVSAWGLWILWAVIQAGHWATLVRPGESHRIEGGLTVLNLETLRSIGLTSHDSPATLAAGLGVLFSWVLALMAFGLALRLLGNLWRLVAPSRD
jgi:hypothetical protein